MRFMVLVKASKESEAGVLPTQSELTAMGKFNDELIKAGVLLAGDGLQPTSKAARIRFSGGKRLVVTKAKLSKAAVAEGPLGLRLLSTGDIVGVCGDRSAIDIHQLLSDSTPIDISVLKLLLEEHSADPLP